jgi:hypothetical protein
MGVRRSTASLYNAFRGVQAVNFGIKRVISLQLLWWFSLFDVVIQSSAGDPQCRTYCWNGMTLIGKHPPSQCDFPTRFELSWPPTFTSPGSGCS